MVRAKEAGPGPFFADIVVILENQMKIQQEFEFKNKRVEEMDAPREENIRLRARVEVEDKGKGKEIIENVV